MARTRFEAQFADMHEIMTQLAVLIRAIVVHGPEAGARDTVLEWTGWGAGVVVVFLCYLFGL